MSEKRYHVIFTGRLASGLDTANAKSNLIIDVGLSDEKAELLLSKGRAVLLKRFPSAAEAQRMAEEFENAGLICRIEDHAGEEKGQGGTGESSLITIMHKFIPVSRKAKSSASRKGR